MDLMATKAQTPESEDSRVRSTELQSVHLVAGGSNAQLCASVEVPFEWRSPACQAYTRFVSLDTRSEAREVYLATVRRQPPSERFLRAIEMSDDARQIAIESEMRRQPNLSRAQARSALSRRILGSQWRQSQRDE